MCEKKKNVLIKGEKITANENLKNFAAKFRINAIHGISFSANKIS